MNALIQQLLGLAQDANETDEETAARLTQKAQATGVDPATLWDLESHVQRLIVHYADENDETLTQARMKAQMLAPAFGVDPADLTDALSTSTLSALIGRAVTTEPRAIAITVRALHEALSRYDLYHQLGVEETPTAAELTPPDESDEER